MLSSDSIYAFRLLDCQSLSISVKDRVPYYWGSRWMKGSVGY